MRQETYDRGRDVFRCSTRMVMGEEWPCMTDDTPRHGYDPHYFYHTAWAARRLAAWMPSSHVDVSSQLQFVTIASAFIPMIYYEYRMPNIDLPGLGIGHADLLSLPFNSDSIGSLSCMHTLEHIGLGRYGDPIDPLADTRAAAELSRVLQPGGRLMMVTPIGKPRVIYNAHRIYSYQMVRDMFGSLTELEFSMYSDKQDKMIYFADPALVELESSKYGACGMWVFEK